MKDEFGNNCDSRDSILVEYPNNLPPNTKSRREYLRQSSLILGGVYLAPFTTQLLLSDRAKAQSLPCNPCPRFIIRNGTGILLTSQELTSNDICNEQEPPLPGAYRLLLGPNQDGGLNISNLRIGTVLRWQEFNSGSPVATTVIECDQQDIIVTR